MESLRRAYVGADNVEGSPVSKLTTDPVRCPQRREGRGVHYMQKMRANLKLNAERTRENAEGTEIQQERLSQFELQKGNERKRGISDQENKMQVSASDRCERVKERKKRTKLYTKNKRNRGDGQIWKSFLQYERDFRYGRDFLKKN